MEFPFNTNSSQAPDVVFSLLNNLISSGTPNTDEIADFIGLPPESCVPSFPTRLVNAEQSLMNGETIGKGSQVWNPYSALPPLSVISPSAPTAEKPSPDVAAPHSSTVPATEDENYALDSKPFFMADLGTKYDLYNPYWDQLPLHMGDSVDGSNEIDISVLESPFMVCQSQQIVHPSCGRSVDPLSEVVAPPNLTVPAIENGQTTRISQSILLPDWQMMANSLPFLAVEYPPSTSYSPLGLRFRQNNIVHSEPFDGSSTSITKLEECYFMEDLKKIIQNRGELHENINFRYQEVDHRKGKWKLNNGRRCCGCKKSKCIKLYCECFSSGNFCNETCGCKGCNNIIEQALLVLNKRVKIERRNSLAFTPKIVPLHQENSEFPGIRLPGWNKRHKRGCSCTKSKCLQNYCECYQSNVKCSVACRCKGCGNMGTHEHGVGLTHFMIGDATNDIVNTRGFHNNGGEMFPQAEASNNIIGRQAGMSSISPVVPLQQWLPREYTSFDNSITSYPTSGTRPLPLMNFYEVSPNHNGAPLMLNDSRFQVREIYSNKKSVPPPRFLVHGTGSSMSTLSLPPFNDPNRRSNSQGYGENNGEV